MIHQQNFYPRSPCGERLVGASQGADSEHISIHALLAESDGTSVNSTQTYYISIHALLAESDLFLIWVARTLTYFYPRSPCGERHGFKGCQQLIGDISIHALLAESDSKSAQNSGALLRIWNKFYGDCIFMLTGKAVFYPFCPCFFHIFWCEGSGNFMIAFPSH